MRDKKGRFVMENKPWNTGKKNPWGSPKKHPNWRGGNEKIICANCGNIFTKPHGYSKSRKKQGCKRHYCSIKCYAEYRSKNIIPWNKGKIFKNPSYNNHGVPPNWRKKILERDGYRCVKCGTTKPLHVHHKIPFRIVKGHTMENMITLCKGCHKKIKK